jgi:hypothetical protein
MALAMVRDGMLVSLAKSEHKRFYYVALMLADERGRSP